MIAAKRSRLAFSRGDEINVRYFFEAIIMLAVNDRYAKRSDILFFKLLSVGIHDFFQK